MRNEKQVVKEIIYEDTLSEYRLGRKLITNGKNLS